MKMKGYLLILIASIALILPSWTSAQSGRKILIAHRGASSYAPEHTLEAYRLAIQQRADYVEQDLQITKDGVLVCLHDLTLERTTNVEEVFPGRFRNDVSADQPTGSQPAKHWYVSDFSLKEIKQLDAGSWFNEKYKGARVPTFQEAIDTVRGAAGLYPETKAPEVYGSRGFDMETLLVGVLKKNQLDSPDPKTPVIIQSFSAASLGKLRTEQKTKLPLTFLIQSDPQKQWLKADGMKRVKAFADGIGPNKALIEAEPMIVKWAHDAGLTVTPYTFRSPTAGQAVGQYKDVREEMRHFLFTFGVDAVFTDNPDMFPR